MSNKGDLPDEPSKVPMHDLTAYARGKGIGESLSDLARHRRPEDLPGPLIFIGVLLFALAGVGILLLVLRSGTAQIDFNLVFLFAILILALVFVGLGIGLRSTTRRTKSHPNEKS